MNNQHSSSDQLNVAITLLQTIQPQLPSVTTSVFNDVITLLQAIQHQQEQAIQPQLEFTSEHMTYGEAIDRAQKLFEQNPQSIYTLTINDNTATTSLHYTLEGAKARAEKIVNNMAFYEWQLDEQSGDWFLNAKDRFEIAAFIELLQVNE